MSNNASVCSCGLSRFLDESTISGHCGYWDYSVGLFKQEWFYCPGCGDLCGPGNRVVQAFHNQISKYTIFFSMWWWKWLFESKNHNGYGLWASIRCRLRGYHNTIIKCYPEDFEPYEHCKDCGEDLW